MQKPTTHPLEDFLRSENLPTVWCPGCGIGCVLHAMINALAEKKVSPDMTLVSTGMGCTQNIGNYLNLDSLMLPHHRVVEFALEYMKEYPEERVICVLNNADLMFSGESDLLGIQGISAPILIVHINNFVYNLKGDHGFPMTPYIRKSMDGKRELPFNLPSLAFSAGAGYIARWTPLKVGWLKHSLIEALETEGLSFIEILNPCLIYDTSNRRILSAPERMQTYSNITQVKNYAPAADWDLRNPEKIIIGTLIDKRTKEKSQS